MEESGELLLPSLEGVALAQEQEDARTGEVDAPVTESLIRVGIVSVTLVIEIDDRVGPLEDAVVEVSHHGSDTEAQCVTADHGLSQRFAPAKELTRQTLGQHDAAPVVKTGGRIALYKRCLEHVEESGVGQHEIAFQELRAVMDAHPVEAEAA